MSSETPSPYETPARSDVAPETLAITAGRSASGSSLAPALWASSTWESESLDDAHRRATSMRHDGFYSRYSNPTVRSFEQAMAELEGRRGVARVRVRDGRHRVDGLRAVLDRQPHRRPTPAVRRHARLPPGAVPSDGHRRHLRRRRHRRRLRRCGRARPHDAGARRDTIEPAARVGRPRRARLDQGSRSRSSTRRSPHRSASSRSRTASTSRCTPPPRESPATTMPPSA